MAERYFDDFKVGDKFTTATKTVTEDMIVEFAKVYDPQLFHIDPKAAQQTHFGGLIAGSGQRFLDENVLTRAQSANGQFRVSSGRRENGHRLDFGRPKKLTGLRAQAGPVKP